MIFLKTQRLILRNLSPEDAEIMFDYRNNPVCAKYQRGQTKDLPGIKALIASHQQDTLSDEENFILAVAIADTGEMIGEIVVMPNDGAITLGYTFSYRHHRRGYGFEALSALVTLLHDRYPQMEFICFTDKENVASMALLRKLGYEHLGYAPNITSEVFGKWITTDIL